MATKQAIYFDGSLCMACKGCQVGCKQWNQTSSPDSVENQAPFAGTYENPPRNDEHTWLHMVFGENEGGPKGVEWAFGREACQHCTNAGCVNACPTGACYHEENGAVVIDPAICIGCEFCISACPYDIPKMSELDGTSRKCWFCMDKVSHGSSPTCVATCPSGAMDFGDRVDMVNQGRYRVQQLKDRGYEKAILYGENEMDGLHVIQVLPYGAEAVRLPVDPSINIMSTLSNWIKPVTALGVGAVLLFLVGSYISARDYERDANELYYDPITKTTYAKSTGEPWFEPDDLDEPYSTKRKYVSDSYYDGKEG